MKNTRLVLLAALIFAPAISRAVTVITSLPYTITSGGSYVLQSNLTAYNTDGIDVKASNVTIDLGGYMLQNSTGTGYFGINVFTGMSNVSIRNGSITGFVYGVSFRSGSQFLLKNVHVFNTGSAISVEGANGCLIENCLAVGASPLGDSGIAIEGCSGPVLVKNNQVFEFGTGIATDTNFTSVALIGNYEANCQDYGFVLHAGDKYQGNISTNCGSNFGGTAVGHENG